MKTYYRQTGVQKAFTGAFSRTIPTENYHDDHHWEIREHKLLCIHIAECSLAVEGITKGSSRQEPRRLWSKKARSKPHEIAWLHAAQEGPERARVETRAAVVPGIKSCWWRQKQEDLWGAIEMPYVDPPAVVLAVKCQPIKMQLIEIWAWCRVFHLLMHDFICKKY